MGVNITLFNDAGNGELRYIEKVIPPPKLKQVESEKARGSLLSTGPTLTADMHDILDALQADEIQKAIHEIKVDHDALKQMLENHILDNETAYQVGKLQRSNPIVERLHNDTARNPHERAKLMQ